MTMESPLAIGYLRHDAYRMISFANWDINPFPCLISHIAYAIDKRGCNLLACDLISEHGTAVLCAGKNENRWSQHKPGSSLFHVGSLSSSFPATR